LVVSQNAHLFTDYCSSNRARDQCSVKHEYCDVDQSYKADVQNRSDKMMSGSQNADESVLDRSVVEPGLEYPVLSRHNLHGFRPSYCVVNCDANKLMLYFDDDDEICFNLNLDASAAMADRTARPIRPQVGSDAVHAQFSVAICRDIYTDNETSLTPTDLGTRNNSVPKLAEARGVAQLGHQWRHRTTGALGHIDTRRPFTMSPVTLMSI